MRELCRTYYIAGHYRQLQGLRLLPLSVPFLVSALWRRGSAAPALPSAWWEASLGLAVAASIPIGRYYERRFGDADARRTRNGALTLLAVTASLVGLGWIQELRPAPVSLPIVFATIVLAKLGLAANRLRAHYLWIAAACVLFEVLPPLGANAEVRAATLDGLVGGGLAVAAIGDHRVLRRMMMERPLA
jgi:hypothetical protein